MNSNYKNKFNELRNNTRSDKYEGRGKTYAAAGIVLGGVAGAATGFVLPPYIAWNAGELLGDAIGLGTYMGAALDLVSVGVIWPLTFWPSILTLGSIGGAAGGVAGGVTGTLVDKLIPENNSIIKK